MNKKQNHIVVGGGISGLGLAHFAAGRGISTLVLEGEERVGGCINSQLFPGTGEYWVEAGSHSCFNSYGNLLEILDELEISSSIMAKQKLRYSLYRDGRQTSIFSALHPLELAFSLPKLLVTKKEGKTVADYYTRVIGEKNYADLFSAAFSSVICQPAGDFPAELLFRKKPRKKEVERSFTLPGGLSQIPEAIAGQSSLQVKAGSPVVAVSREQNCFLVHIEGGDAYETETLSLAVPPDSAARLLPDEFAALREQLLRIKTTEIESLALCVPKSEITLAPLAGLIAVEEPFYSMVSRDYLDDEHYRGFAFHFKPGSLLDEDAKLACCARALGIEPGQIESYTSMQNRLPVLRSGHSELLEEIDSALRGTHLALTGNYFFGVSIEDCLVRSRQEYERLFS